MTVNHVSIAGLSLSILFLLISISIFSLVPALRCGRVIMHNNLCISLLLSNISWIIWHYVVLAQNQVNLYNLQSSRRIKNEFRFGQRIVSGAGVSMWWPPTSPWVTTPGCCVRVHTYIFSSSLHFYRVSGKKLSLTLNANISAPRRPICLKL